MRPRAAGPVPLFRGSLLLAPRGGGRGGRPAERCLARSPAGPGAVRRIGVCRSLRGRLCGRPGLLAGCLDCSGPRGGRPRKRKSGRPRIGPRALRLGCVGGVGARRARPSLPRVEGRSHGLNPGAVSAPGNPEFLGISSWEAGKNGTGARFHSGVQTR